MSSSVLSTAVNSGIAKPISLVVVNRAEITSAASGSTFTAVITPSVPIAPRMPSRLMKVVTAMIVVTATGVATGPSSTGNSAAR